MLWALTQKSMCTDEKQMSAPSKMKRVSVEIFTGQSQAYTKTFFWVALVYGWYEHRL